MFRKIGRKYYTMKGEGIISDIQKKIIQKLQKRPRVVDKLLKEVGDRNIVRLDVCRNPINSIFRKALNILTRGKFEDVVKKYAYDDIYHLFMNMTLDDGTVYSIEKNQRVKLKKGGIKTTKKGECRTMKINKNLRTFIQNGEKTGNSFYRYSAHQHNCQDFIMRLLSSNGIHGLNSFVKQNAKELLTPFASKIVQGITDVGAVGDFVLHGGKKRPVRKRRYKYK